MLKKILLTILILLFAILAVFFTWRYQKYKNDPNPDHTFLLPRVELSVIEITSLTPEKTEMNASILIKNQLPFGFTANSFQYAFYIDDVEVIKSRYDQSIHLEGGDSSWVKLPITINLHDIDSIIKSNEHKDIDSVTYRLDAHFSTDLLFEKQFDVSIKRFLPLIYVPEIKMEEVKVDSLNFKRAAILVDISLLNKNVFDIKLKDYAYEIQIEDHKVLKGFIKGPIVLKAKDTTPLTIPLTLSLKEVSKTLFELLKKGSDVNYKLHLTLKIASDQKMMDNSKVIVASEGSVKSLLKVVKGK